MKIIDHIESGTTQPHPQPVLSPFGHFFRFTARWFGFTGLYAAFSVCPFCGQAGCPVGVGIAGSMGAFFALCLMDWKRLLGYIGVSLKNRLKGVKP